MFDFFKKKISKTRLFKSLSVIFAIALIIALNSNFVTAEEGSSLQPYISRFLDRVTEFRLDNGMKFIVIENHEAPVVSFVTYADVGGVDEPDGQTGVAHFLEHLAFKGTKSIGTEDYKQEKVYLKQLDRLFSQIKVARSTGDEAQLAQLTEEFNKIEAQASSFVKQNEYGQIVDTAGGVGLNAVTSADYTSYFYSFPSNKLELWMSLESERFLNPVFREFYKERQVILEERRMRTDDSPIGKTIEKFLDTAFVSHPYKRPTIGYNKDIRNLTRKNVRDFFNQYYTPNNLTVAIAGDVNPQDVKALAEVYFGRFERKIAPPEVQKVEPKQTETKEVIVKLPTQPWYLEGYHIAGLTDPDYPVYELLTSILSSGRTSRLYQSLVEQQQVALSAQGFSGFPGNKYPNLMLFYALTAPGYTVDDVAIALREQIELLKAEPVTTAELDRIKTQFKAGLLRSLDSNLDMARILTEYEAKTGDWRNLFNQLEAITEVTAEDIQRVARSIFTDENRTIGKLLSVSS